MINVALIGNGGIAQSHLKGYRELIEEGFPIRVAAVCDAAKKTLPEGFENARVYDDLDTLLENEKNLDYADICLPTFLHAEYAIRCMRAGLHVLSEKPMALNEEQTKEMLDCAEETGKKLMIAHVMRFFEPMRIIRRYVVDQIFGKPKSAFFTRPDGRPNSGFNGFFWKDELSGGCIMDLGIHDIDVVQWLFGMPKAVSTIGGCLHTGAGWEYASTNFIYEDGLFVHSWVDWTIPNNKHQNRVVRVNFEHGYIYHERGSRNVFEAVSEDGTVTDLSKEKTMPDNFFRNEIECFARCIIDEQPIRVCRPVDSAAAIRMVLAQRRSADLGGELVYLKEDEA